MDSSSQMKEDIRLKRHVKFFSSFLQIVPSAYTTLDQNRLMVVYFACSALDILGALDTITNKEEIIEWVYHQQIVRTNANGDASGGFIGGGFTGSMEKEEDVTSYHYAHVSMTYCALLILTILGDDFSRVDKEGITKGLAAIQQKDGSFQAVAFGTESDMRFVFCAAAISFMIQDFSGINVEETAKFISSSQSFDGGFGIMPNQETHSGAIYTALAALVLLGKVETVEADTLISFLVSRQIGGFNGRINKKPDTCYTFWVGGSLQMLGLVNLIEEKSTREFLMTCQSSMGGFSKVPGDVPEIYPDILHAYYSICGLSLIGEPGFRPIDATLGLTERAMKSLPTCKDGQLSTLKTGAGNAYKAKDYSVIHACTVNDKI